MGKLSALKKVLGETWDDLPTGAKLGGKIGAGLAVSGAGAAGINLLNDELSGKNPTQRAILRKIQEAGENPEKLASAYKTIKELLG
jgi:hypothetical protein